MNLVQLPSLETELIKELTNLGFRVNVTTTPSRDIISLEDYPAIFFHYDYATKEIELSVEEENTSRPIIFSPDISRLVNSLQQLIL